MFARIREEKPHVMKKLIMIEGDVMYENLGVEQHLLQQLLEEVSVVFNFAATLKLEAPLKVGLEMNTRGTQRVLEVVKGMKNLAAFIHLSTAFCYPDYEKLDEKVHDPPVDPHEILRAANWLTEEQMSTLAPSILQAHPNSYTFSKRLAEALVSENYPRLPAAIVRPSIGTLAIEILAHPPYKIDLGSCDFYLLPKIKENLRGKWFTDVEEAPYEEAIEWNSKLTPSYREPVPGWVDNLNGPAGVVVGAGKGVIRSMLCYGDYHAEGIPVDIAINAIIVSAYYVGIQKGRTPEIPVFNVTSGDDRITTWKEALEFGKAAGRKYPFEGPLWYPNGNIRSNKLIHNLCVFFFHIIPAYFIDFLMLILGQKRFMVRIQKRISVGLEMLQYFTTREWWFSIDKYKSLSSVLGPEDSKTFSMDITIIDDQSYAENGVIGGKLYCMKEKMENLPKARLQHNILYVLDLLVTVLFYLYVLSLIASYSETVRQILKFGGPVTHTLPFVGKTVFVFPKVVQVDLQGSTGDSTEVNVGHNKKWGSTIACSSCGPNTTPWRRASIGLPYRNDVMTERETKIERLLFKALR
ncbi:Putative fatty acyl-CoA reductase CG5065 [Eumeta japonica]|uniref:Fatty acyl-CoA reductase n=1 Tax=Eumeta variegata TaxID=151549 RepID=A0A4C1WQE9_EUMVA|nr:Putative fatty acyl-CoA reductase CG5065 [Eumeta japonica]